MNFLSDKYTSKPKTKLFCDSANLALKGIYQTYNFNDPQASKPTHTHTAELHAASTHVLPLLTPHHSPQPIYPSHHQPPKATVAHPRGGGYCPNTAKLSTLPVGTGLRPLPLPLPLPGRGHLTPPVGLGTAPVGNTPVGSAVGTSTVAVPVLNAGVDVATSVSVSVSEAGAEEAEAEAEVKGVEEATSSGAAALAAGREGKRALTALDHQSRSIQVSNSVMVVEPPADIMNLPSVPVGVQS